MTMTACAWLERDEVFEGYVRDALVPEERDAFEAHYFECAACADKLRTCEALQAELRVTAAEAASRSPVRTRPWRWALVPVAAGVAIIAAVALWLSPPPAGPPASKVAVGPAQQARTAPPLEPAAKVPAPRALPSPVRPRATPQVEPQRKTVSPPAVAFSVLARVEPPVYIPVALRGTRDEAVERFDGAMRHYVEGDYAAAIPELRAAADLNPKAPNVVFFLAMCELLTGRTEPAVTGLQRTIALGESPYLEEAHFYLAKARLRQGDVRAARQQLQRAVERRGRLEAEARRLLAQVDALSQQKDRPPAK